MALNRSTTPREDPGERKERNLERDKEKRERQLGSTLHLSGGLLLTVAHADGLFVPLVPCAKALLGDRIREWCRHTCVFLCHSEDHDGRPILRIVH